MLYYGEDNGRVQALEPVVAATRYFADEQQLGIKLTLDSLTGASPMALRRLISRKPSPAPAAKAATPSLRAKPLGRHL